MDIVFFLSDFYCLLVMEAVQRRCVAPFGSVVMEYSASAGTPSGASDCKVSELWLETEAGAEVQRIPERIALPLPLVFWK